MTAVPPSDEWFPFPDRSGIDRAVPLDALEQRPAGVASTRPTETALRLLTDVIAFEAAVMGHAMRRPSPLRLRTAALWRRERDDLDLARCILRARAVRVPVDHFVPFGRPHL